MKGILTHWCGRRSFAVANCSIPPYIVTPSPSDGFQMTQGAKVAPALCPGPLHFTERETACYQDLREVTHISGHDRNGIV